MNKDSAKVRFVSDDERTALPLPRFVTRTTLKDLLDGEPLEPDAPGVDAPGVDAPPGDPAAPPTTA
ncbi:hypothetical protein F2P45_05170 [Massilia sp. CCM 8733]|uniref:Uncharacterized protein n=1 Tax=Massilia mucilaginosa TaxID=2609282 RepID=A0ABX0NNP8_9BURK|nr:hypothetical protein [Massilia mucilaginosa]NHZ88418.1 hypothetical protein [Massilia mucilaginosa]